MVINKRNNNSEWEQVSKKHVVMQKPLITIRRNGFAFNSYFVKIAEIETKTNVSIKVSPQSMLVGFSFSNRDSIDTCSISKDGGQGQRNGKGRIVQISNIFRKYLWIREVSSLEQIYRQFIPYWDNINLLWVISICPPFEIKVSNKSDIPNGISGIYRYKLGDDIVYIGRGFIKQRIQSHESENWNYETIEYSIVTKESEQKKWESYWLDKYVEKQDRLPFYNRALGNRH
jgi:hypothetical protein